MPRNATARLSGTRKAAILMVLLGPDAAGALLRNLPRPTVARIAAEVKLLDEIPSGLAQSVLEEYFVEAVKPVADRGGAEVARRLLAVADIPEQERTAMLGPEATADPAVEMLGPLLDAPPRLLATALGEEHPQTSALVLLNLSAEKAGNVLALLTTEQRSEALQRMCGLRNVRGELVDEVVSSLRDRIGASEPALSEPETDGVARTARVLETMRRSEVRELLDEIEKVDAEQAQRLREMVNTFDSLLLADDRGVQELLRVVETKTLALALKDEAEPLQEKFLSNLSERAAGMLREEMEFLGVTRPDDKKNAQSEIVKAALQLEQDEKLTFMDQDGAAG